MLISYSGTPATTSQMAKDVTTFLSWAAEPEHDERKKNGIKAVIIFSSLFCLSLYVKRFKWSTLKNRKICMFFLINLASSPSLTPPFQSTNPPQISLDIRHSKVVVDNNLKYLEFIMNLSLRTRSWDM